MTEVVYYLDGAYTRSYEEYLAKKDSCKEAKRIFFEHPPMHDADLSVRGNEIPPFHMVGSKVCNS